jgi:hypothetical protein
VQQEDTRSSLIENGIDEDIIEEEKRVMNAAP